MSPGCLDEGEVLAFLGGALPEPARAAVEAHLGACGACCDLATWAAADLAGPGRTAGREGRPFVGQLAPGAHVGRYQILGAVGRGGMGEVYAAYHPDLDRRIALKVVYESGASMAERRRRLLREARAIARLSHPNVVGVHDAGTVGDHVYVAMEFVDGQTVDEWLRGGERSWREILDVFVAAGRGLAAAHAAGVVHRDFKPQNVMVGRDGVVRVMDFGLARVVGEAIGAAGEGQGAGAPAREKAPGEVAVAPATETGALLGTPAYMAPEQLRGEPPDARADQFSFCVALHEALYGVRPAPAGAGGEAPAVPNPPEEAQSAPARRATVPAWLRAVLRRGLSGDREGRYPSMEALLAALARGQGRVRRRVSIASAALAILLVSLAGWRLARGGRIACVVPKERLAAAWSDDPGDARREKVRRAFLASGRAQAETSWRRVASRLDGYLGEWRKMYVDACEATHVRGEQSSEVLDLRMECLGTNLDEVRALADGLATADAEVVARAGGAVANLTPVARCADLAVLRSAVPLPRDPRVLAEVQELRRALRDAEAARELGRFSKALEMASRVKARIERTGYKPLWAEWLVIAGGAQASLFNSLEAERLFEEAFPVALSAGDHLSAAKAASGLTITVGCDLRRFEEAERWAKLGNASLDSLPPSSERDRIRGWLAQDLALVRRAQRRYEEARELIENALRLKEASLGRDHPDVAVSLEHLALTIVELGEPHRALEMSARAGRIYLQHAPDSHYVSRWLTNHGEILAASGRYPEAQASFERSLPLLEGEMGRNCRGVAHPLTGLGQALLAQGKPGEAIGPLERALAIRTQGELDPRLSARTRFLLAQALWAADKDRSRSRALASEAARQLSSAGLVKEAAEVTVWLASDRVRGRASQRQTVTPGLVRRPSLRTQSRRHPVARVGDRP